MRGFGAFLIMALVALGASSVERARAASDVEIVGTDFGLFENSTPQARFTPASSVPLIDGQSYGWRIFVRTDRSSVRYHEEFTLPKAPQTWGTLQPGQTISADRRTSIMERNGAVKGGVLENRWEVATGDPRGKYMIRVFIDGAQVATFPFEVK